MNRRLLHYEILHEIGRGGMGVVYQARDTHLDRLVAIKVLPPDAVVVAGRKQRFIQEARAASALNHPNIVTVHDVSSDDGVDFMVMEYVDGRTLDELIPGKGLRASVALKYAVQIADALAKAHGAGILHRDLKPSNLKVTEDGRVKVLDFGLAKMTDPISTPDDATFSARELTGEGAVIGTAAYMSPEQAEGRKLDSRSDIFSFGSVLYEMLTGQKPFPGDSRFSTIARILNDEPKPATELVPSIPPELAKIVARCMRKNPARRYQYMADLKIALEDIEEESATGAHGPAARSVSQWRWAGAIAILVVAAGSFLTWWQLRAPADSRPLQAVPLTAFPGAETHPSISPDGNYVAFTWSGPQQDNDDIYVQQMDSGAPLRLTRDTASDISPAWSPDGRWIAFLRGTRSGRSELRLIPPLGGHERVLTQIHVRHLYADPPFLSWFPDSRALVVVDSEGEGKPDLLFVVSAETGEKRPLTTAEGPSLGETNPAVSSDGRAVVFRRNPSADLHWLGLTDERTGIGRSRQLTPTAMNAGHPAWLPGGNEILFDSQGSLWKVNVSGTASPARVPYVGDGVVMPVVSRVQPGRPMRLVYVRISIDHNIWRVDTRTPGTPAVAPPVLAIASTQRELNAQFSPDGSRVAFFSNRSGKGEIWLANPDGSDAVQLTTMGAPNSGTPRWSADGRTIAFDSNLEGQYEVYAIAASGGTPHRLTTHASDDHVPSFSRDGKWIYFSSNRGGSFQIWKVPASGGDAVQVTQNGGFVAFESRDGAQLYYTQTPSAASALWRVATSGGKPVKVLEGVIQRAFTVIDSGIYYIDQKAQNEDAPALRPAAPPSRALEARLRFFSFAKGTSAIVSTLGDRIAVGLTASPDGRTILYSRVDPPLSDLMLVDNFR